MCFELTKMTDYKYSYYLLSGNAIEIYLVKQLIPYLNGFIRSSLFIGLYVFMHSKCTVLSVKRYKKAKIRKRRNQKEIPTQKTEVGKKPN